MAGSRVTNSVRNVFAAWGGQAIYAIGVFAVRAVLVAKLAQVFVGLESLFASILTILSLADLGVGSAIVFALYKPLAEDDRDTVKSLMRLFKRAYITIGVAILALGAALAPNVRLLLGADAPDIPLLEVYFYCFVLNTGVSYFFSYKGSLIMADQKNYIVYLIQYAFQIAMCGAQIAVLLVFESYLPFLICMIASTFLQNVVICIVSNRMYPYLKEKDVKPLDRGILSDIKKNIVGLMMHKIAGAASTPASNLIITNFVSLAATSLYGNYLLIVNALTQVIEKVFSSIIASVGNLGVTESKERQYEVFQTTFFVNALVYVVVSTGFLCCVNDFIAFLFGDEWRFPPLTVFLIVFLFCVKGLREAAMSFTSAYGLYWMTKWKAVLEAVALPLLALLFVGPWGIDGVLVACAVSSLGISTVYEGWAVYKFALERPLRAYIAKFAHYLACIVAIMLAAFLVSGFIPLYGLLGFLVKGAFGVAFSAAIWFVLFGRTREWGEAVGMVKRVGGKLVGKLVGKKGA